MPSSSKHYARFIPSEEVGMVTEWKFGAMDGSDQVEEEEAPELPPVPDPVDEEAQLEMIRQACDDAFARGVEEGRLQAAVEWQQRMDDYVAQQGRELADRIQSAVAHLDMQLQDMQQHMARDVLALACDIARDVVRQELSVNTEALLPVVQEAVGMLVAEGRPAVVRLHPDDMETLAQPLRDAVDAPHVQWQADAAVAPGGCQVESGGLVIDGSLEKRWSRAVASLGLETPWQGVPSDGR